MDTLTHTVLGACMGEAIAGKKLGKKAMLIGALVHNLPDVDVISGLWTEQAEGLLAHRGITHSIIFNLVLSFLLAQLFYKRSKHSDVPFKTWLFLIGSGLFTHILVDAFTSYGTGWFEPFNHFRVTFNTMFILDPFFMLPVLVTALILLFLKKENVKRTRIAKTGLCITLFYVVMTWIDKINVDGEIEKNLKEQHIVCDDYMATPTPLNNFLWFVVTKSANESYTGFYSVFDKDPHINFDRFSKNDSLLEPFKDAEEVQLLKRFSKGYYCVTKEDGNIIFNDMRFGQIGGWDEKQAPFVFHFYVKGQPNKKTQLQQGRFKSISGDVIKKLYRRVIGEK